MELNLTVPGKKTTKKLDVSDAVFAREFNEPLVHQVVTAYLAGGRSGNSAQKTRSEVSGGGKKPWKQKGTGRARAGTTRGPIWRSGGVTFASKQRDYSQKVNKKVYRAALRAIFSELVRQDRLIVLEEFDIEMPKTKVLAEKLKSLSLSKAMIILENVDEKIYLAARNLPGVDIRDTAGIDPVSLINYETIVVTVPAIKQIEEWLG